MKISIITAVYNGERFIADCLKSVVAQTYPDIEYIVVDGNSKDDTLNIVQKLKKDFFKVVSEPDINLYDAMNKGLAIATGDIIGFLNADDFYTSNDAIAAVVQKFEETNTNIVIGDLEFVDPIETSRVTRFVTPKQFDTKHFLIGEQPPHPTFFARRCLYEKYGNFNIKYPICADYDLLLRFMYVHQEPWVHLPKTLIRMRTGGVSNRGLLDKLRFNTTKLEICRSHGIQTSPFKMYSRYLGKGMKLLRERLSPLSNQ